MKFIGMIHNKAISIFIQQILKINNGCFIVFCKNTFYKCPVWLPAFWINFNSFINIFHSHFIFSLFEKRHSLLLPYICNVWVFFQPRIQAPLSLLRIKRKFICAIVEMLFNNFLLDGSFFFS